MKTYTQRHLNRDTEIHIEIQRVTLRDTETLTHRYTNIEIQTDKHTHTWSHTGCINIEINHLEEGSNYS